MEAIESMIEMPEENDSEEEAPETEAPETEIEDVYKSDNEDEDKQRRSIMDDAGYENTSDDSPANDAQDEEEDRQRRAVLNDDDYSDIKNAKYSLHTLQDLIKEDL